MPSVSYTHLVVNSSNSANEYEINSNQIKIFYSKPFEGAYIPIIGPVSYTHLDVYKRQPMDFINVLNNNTDKNIWVITSYSLFIKEHVDPLVLEILDGFKETWWFRC